MTPGDYSPPAAPTTAQQQDALRMGLGRAAAWAAAGALDEGVLLAACLTDQRFDGQVDAGRADWLWGMVAAAGATGRFRGPLLDALRDTPDESSVRQLCALAALYAAAGDGELRARLYEVVERKPVEDSPWLGEAEIVALDGEAGFLFAAGVRGRLSIADPETWDDGDLISAAGDRFGKARVAELLDTSADAGVRRSGENWAAAQARHKAWATTSAAVPKVAAMTVADVLREADAGRGGSLLRRWGRQAGPADLRTVLGHVWDARKPEFVANLLAVFGDRALPEFDARLLDLYRHADKQVRRRAFDALGQNSHPAVRAFALDKLARGVADHETLALFTRNFERGDERRLLDALPTPDDDGELHAGLMSLLEVGAGNPDADVSQLGVVAYALTPCTYCRRDAAELLSQRDAAPGWLRDECRHDANPECRAVFAGG